jgi:phage I-like protein
VTLVVVKAATLPLFSLAPIEVTAEMVAMAAGKTPPFEGMTPGKPIQVFPMGAGRTVDGRKVKAETADFALLLGDLATRRNPVTLTVEHEMDPTWGSRAAGEISSDAFLEQADGFWGLEPRWTEAALAEIRSGARRWISPTFYGTEVEGVIRPRILRDISLVSVPNLDGMQPVTASASRDGAATSHPTSPSKASERKEQETMKLSADTLKLLGLADGASLEDIDKAVVKLAAEKAPAPDVEKAATAAVEKFRADFEKSVREQLERESAQNARKTRVAGLIERAEVEGKLVADNREALTALAAADPESFEKVLPGLKVLAPVKRWHTASRQGAEKVAVSDVMNPETSKELHERAMALSADKKVSYSEALNSLVAA